MRRVSDTCDQSIGAVGAVWRWPRAKTNIWNYYKNKNEPTAWYERGIRINESVHKLGAETVRTKERTQHVRRTQIVRTLEQRCAGEKTKMYKNEQTHTHTHMQKVTSAPAVDRSHFSLNCEESQIRSRCRSRLPLFDFSCGTVAHTCCHRRRV